MQFSYRGFLHPANECTVAIKVKNNFDKAGRRIGRTETWNITGLIQAATQLKVDAACAAMEQAYEEDGGDAILYLNAGGPAHRKLTTADSLTGVRVLEGVDYPDGKGADFSTYRHYAITLEATYYKKKGKFNLLEWQETLSWVGTGGPKFIFLPLLVGIPDKQFTQQHTTVKLTQSGHAIGRYKYPRMAKPLFPGDEHVDQRGHGKETPKRKGPPGRPFLTDYKVDWSYHFESVNPMNANPTPWPELD